MASKGGQAYQQMGGGFFEGSGRALGVYLSHQTRHTMSQVCTVSNEMGMKKGEEEGAYLFFVHSKEGLHWSIGASSREKDNI